MRVEPLRLEWIEALIDGDDAFTERFGIAVIEGWAGFPEALPRALRCAIAPARQGRGLATTATRTLVEWARDRGATRAVAHTLATPNASTAVLVRCGSHEPPPSPTPTPTTASTTTSGAANSN